MIKTVLNILGRGTVKVLHGFNSLPREVKVVFLGFCFGLGLMMFGIGNRVGDYYSERKWDTERAKEVEVRQGLEESINERLKTIEEHKQTITTLRTDLVKRDTVLLELQVKLKELDKRNEAAIKGNKNEKKYLNSITDTNELLDYARQALTELGLYTDEGGSK